MPRILLRNVPVLVSKVTVYPEVEINSIKYFFSSETIP
jgi:hypothetical protein